MGVYAQTHFYITTDNVKTAKEVVKRIKKLTKTDKNGNTFGEELYASKDQAGGFMCSGRIQNLEYRCEMIWEVIKDIKGVSEMNCPFLSEADGYYQSN